MGLFAQRVADRWPDALEHMQHRSPLGNRPTYIDAGVAHGDATVFRHGCFGRSVIMAMVLVLVPLAPASLVL